MIHPFLFLLGFRRLRTQREDAGRVLNLCRQMGFSYRNLSFGETFVEMDFFPWTAKRVYHAAAERGISVTLGDLRGFPGILFQRRKRFGILIGLLLCAWMVYGSEQVLFSIQVDGNSRLSDREVIEELERCGFSVGDSLKGLDTSVLENRVLIASEEIAWISVNLRGNVAHVVIRERQTAAPEEEMTASNLVASRGGVIEWFEEVRGNPAVEIGDAVGEGDLLVGGIFGKEDGPLRLTRASGKVFARTEHSFEVRIPLRYEKKEYTGAFKIEKYLIFFKKEVKFFANTGNLSATCDTIDTVEAFGLSGDRILPVGIRTVRYAEYTTVQATREADAAEELAYYQLRLQMESEVPEGMLVRKTLRYELTDEEFILWCDAEYLEDIAKPVKIEVEGASLPWRRNDANYGND